MRVAIFTESLGCGGISSYCLELASTLQGMPGIDVCLAGISDNRWFWLIDQAQLRGLELVQVPLSGRYDWSGMRRLHNFLVERRIDVVHTQGYRLNLLVRAAKLVYGTPVKLVNTVHGVSAFRGARPTSRMYYMFDYATLFLSDGIIAVSAATRERLLSWHVPSARKAVVIHNGVQTPCAVSNEQRAGMQSELGLTARENTVGFVGRLSREKGVDLLAKVIRAVLQKNPKAQFLIVGDGALRGLIRELVEEWPGKVVHVGEQQNVHAYLELMGMLLLTSETEGMPMVILEAFSHGVPAVATNVGGVPEVVTEGATGFLHSQVDVEGLAGSVIRLLDDGPLRARMAENCLAQHASRFSCGHMAERTYEVYRKVAGTDTVAKAN